MYGIEESQGALQREDSRVVPVALGKIRHVLDHCGNTRVMMMMTDSEGCVKERRSICRVPSRRYSAAVDAAAGLTTAYCLVGRGAHCCCTIVPAANARRVFQ